MRIGITVFLAAALGMAPTSSTHAQLAANHAVVDSGNAPRVLALARPSNIRLADDPSLDPVLEDVHRRALARQRRESPRMPYIAVGALIGAVGGAAYALHDSRDGALGYFGGVILVPIGMVGGMFAGGAAGYVVSFVFVPPGRGGR